MANNLGRDKVGWSQEFWNEVDRAVHDTVSQIRVAAKVFTPQPIPNATYVTSGTIDPVTGAVPSGSTLALVEVARRFVLPQDQVADPTGQRANILAAVRYAATSVAQLEDEIIFTGENGPQVPILNVIARNRRNANVARGAQIQPRGDELRIIAGDPRDGLLGAVNTGPINVAQQAGGPPVEYGINTYNATLQGIAQLQAAGEPGPYVLFLPNGIYADTHRLLPNTSTSVRDLLQPLVKGGIHGTGGLPGNRGLLVSLAGDPVNLTVALDASTECTQQNADGQYTLRVVERMQYVVRNPQALIRFDFQ